jgi:sortase A
LPAWAWLGEKIRKGLLLFAELAFTAAFVIGLFIAYQLWFTNQVADSAAKSISSEIREGIKAQTLASESAVLEVEVQGRPYTVTSLGLIYIPRLKDDVWATPILVGVGNRELALGVGYYPGAATPGETGNFAIAGHRATNGEPFARFEKLQAGDQVFIETAEGWFEYRLVENKKIADSATWVLDAEPKGLNLGSDRLITLTTCDPRWNSTRRWAWWGVLVSKYQEPPAAIGAEVDL